MRVFLCVSIAMMTLTHLSYKTHRSLFKVPIVETYNTEDLMFCVQKPLNFLNIKIYYFYQNN